MTCFLFYALSCYLVYVIYCLVSNVCCSLLSNFSCPFFFSVFYILFWSYFVFSICPFSVIFRFCSLTNFHLVSAVSFLFSVLGSLVSFAVCAGLCFLLSVAFILFSVICSLPLVLCSLLCNPFCG